jgi:hypothetical protein
MELVATHGSHHAVELDSPVGCSVCVGMINIEALMQSDKPA